MTSKVAVAEEKLRGVACPRGRDTGVALDLERVGLRDEYCAAVAPLLRQPANNVVIPSEAGVRPTRDLLLPFLFGAYIPRTQAPL